ncbi:MAG: trypsin-like peptidase domain-containing protein [Candidatus Tectomicrobia bacterium]|nr:trypsin-like peptidase domain-containing protein [Candidatus Tectomicrobia bacterium]
MPRIFSGSLLHRPERPAEAARRLRRGLASVLLLISAGVAATPDARAKTGCSAPLPDLYEKVSPAVVFISAVSIDPFRVKDRIHTSIGSGFIISKEGLVLTNSHVVFGRQAITVTLDDGTRVSANLLGADPILDLAVLRIAAPGKKLPVLTLGDSKGVRTGEEVIAIGNPFGLEQTLTRGIVSGVNRILPESVHSMMLPLIQTDASINPGNSGGPLLNRCGEVIGINTAVLTEAQNIGFAVPVNVAKQVLPQLLKKGRVVRPWFGASGKWIEKDVRKLLNWPLVDGFLVETIEPGSPAEAAGVRGGRVPITIEGEEFLLGGDIITAADGQPLNSPEKVEKFVQSLKVGATVRLTLFREGKTRKVEIRLPERPLLPGDAPSDRRSTLSPMRSVRPNP